MKRKFFWNQTENRLRAGWRILIQSVMILVPLVALGLVGFYDQGNLSLKVALTAFPITLVTVFILVKYVDKRKQSDLGVHLRQKKWWQDYGFGFLAGVLAASVLTGMLVLMGWAEIVPSSQPRYGIWSFAGSFTLALLSYMSVGIFEEILRTYQIQNVTEGLSVTKLGKTWAVILAVILGGLWSVLAHVSSKDPSFLVYVMVTGTIYGLFFIWTKRAALAMAMHFAWDFTNSAIFQLGSSSETSLFFVRLKNLPDLRFDIMSILGIIAKVIGLLLVLWWIRRQEGQTRIKPGLNSPTLL